MFVIKKLKLYNLTAYQDKVETEDNNKQTYDMLYLLGPLIS